MFEQERIFPVGAKVLIRDAEWRIKKVDTTEKAGYQLTCVGLSDIVRNKEAVFFEHYEDRIEILTPESTRLVTDLSAGFKATKLYLEALFRNSPKTDPGKIVVANHAAMDPLPYQFNPTLQALSQPRARIMIADAVGIGKTLEAGILTSELIARGRGRRILVLATKSMLSQFQQEFWNRFSIPLVRLDSAGIQRVRNKIPTNHNPFLFFDRSIISIDTLKQDLEYREYLKSAYWDIIIIDEAHNVAQRNNRSQRARLAQLLAGRSDTMIMLSATPHDGRAESFASLLNILDPTAIVNPSDYQLSDFAQKGLVIRRFKKDVRNQIQKEFPDREIQMISVNAGPEENAVYQYLSTLTFTTLDCKQRTGAQLFATTLTKAMFSSPAACRSVIKHRLQKLDKHKDQALVAEDKEKLKTLDHLIARVSPDKFTKLSRLGEMLGSGPAGLGWNPKDPTDRLVVFTESVETLNFLAEHLPGVSGIKPKQMIVLSGAMSDNDIAEKVNEFNRGDSPVRLLLCSDVASEGINLHHFSHRMIHFDIPWSLMTFQQRNGRIDRYGQERVPQIRYMQTVADNEKSRGDARVLELLTQKDEQAQRNLEDPAEFLMTQQEQEDKTAAQMEGQPLDEQDIDDIFDLFGEDESESASTATAIAPVLTQKEYEDSLSRYNWLYPDDMSYAKAVLQWLVSTQQLRNDFVDLQEEHRILLNIPKDLEQRLKYLPSEVLPETRQFDLTDDTKKVQANMQQARAVGQAWPQQTLLWALHPVMNWLQDKALGLFGRHTAPVVHLNQLRDGERWILIQGGYPNRRGYIPIHRWIAVHEEFGRTTSFDLQTMIDALHLDRELSNTQRQTQETDEASERYHDSVVRAIEVAKAELIKAKVEFDNTAKRELDDRLSDLDRLRTQHLQQVEEKLANQIEAIRHSRELALKSQIQANFDSAKQYIENTATTQEEPFMQLVAVFAPMQH